MSIKLRKIVWFSLGAAILIYILTLSYQYFDSKSAYSLPLAGQMIVLDPGHGGRDGGAASQSGVLEKDVTLTIAFYLRDLLEPSGAFVTMTRETDTELSSEESRRKGQRKREDLTNRVRLINESDADFLVSIHLNSIPSPKWSGAQTFYDPSREENKRMAELVQEELIRNLENTNRQEKATQDIFLLKHAQIPGILVEAGFLSNPEEASLLNTEEYQKKVALAIYMGILRYYGES